MENFKIGIYNAPTNELLALTVQNFTNEEAVNICTLNNKGFIDRALPQLKAHQEQVAKLESEYFDFELNEEKHIYTYRKTDDYKVITNPDGSTRTKPTGKIYKFPQYPLIKYFRPYNIKTLKLKNSQLKIRYANN